LTFHIIFSSLNFVTWKLIQLILQNLLNFFRTKLQFVLSSNNNRNNSNMYYYYYYYYYSC